MMMLWTRKTTLRSRSLDGKRHMVSVECIGQGWMEAIDLLQHQLPRKLANTPGPEGFQGVWLASCRVIPPDARVVEEVALRWRRLEVDATIGEQQT